MGEWWDVAHPVDAGAARRKPWRDERGANLLEFALVVPVLMLIVFGIIEFGVAYNNSLSLRAGAQEGARAGVVANFGPTTPTGCTLATPTGPTTGSAAGRLMCLTKNRIGLNQASVRLNLSFIDGGGTAGAMYEVGDYIRICAEFPLNSVSGFFGPFLNGRKQTVHAEMRIEQVSVPALLAASEGNPAC